MNDTAIKKMMNEGETFNLTYDGRGFKLRDSNKKISDLPITHMDNKRERKVSLSRSMKHKVIIDAFTGNELRQYINNIGIAKLKERDFVQGIVEYCSHPVNRVLSISGLRGTGKTTGVLQAIDRMNIYDSSVFITIDELASMDCLDLRQLIMDNYKDKKYIFIDEITRVKDIINNSGFLADSLCAMGKRVVISGTDSLGLVKSESAGLYHRVISKNVTHISYAEAKRTMRQTLNEYMQLGGLYKENKVKDIDGLRKYIETAVIDNIYNTMTKNKGATGLLGLEGIKDKSKLRTLVFRIIYAIIYLNIQKSTNTSVKYMIDLFDIRSSSVYTNKVLNSLVCSQMLVDEKVTATQTEMQAVLSAMEDMGLLVKATNIFNKTEVNYYITNPSIVNQLLGSIVTILEKTNIGKAPGATVKGKRGILFESIIVAHTKMAADKYGNTLYYYHDTNNREVDLIIERQTMDEFDDIYLYYEIKMTRDPNIAVVKSKWINDSAVDKFAEAQGTVIGKEIIYGGDTQIFNGFTDKNMLPPKGMSLQDIERQNSGIELIAAEDYLLHTEDKLQSLERYEV